MLADRGAAFGLRCIRLRRFNAAGRVVLDGASPRVRADVHLLSGYSAHADQQGLLEWVDRMEGKPNSGFP